MTVTVRCALLFLVAALAVVAPEAATAAREQIRIVGSSTVFPFTTTVAEAFGRTTDFRTPVVESTGTGGGLKLFCAGLGEAHPDIANTSRRIKRSEVENCAKNGVGDIVEIRIGFDGIVLANALAAPPYALSLEQIFLALGKLTPGEGKAVPNPHATWRDISPSLPAVGIEVFGPPPTSGTRDAFVELVLEPGCRRAFEAVAIEPGSGVCQSLREDGAYIEASENDNLIVQKLDANPNALGVFGYSFLDQNLDTVQASAVDGVTPDFDRIADGAYPASRSMFVYVKRAHVGRVAGIEEFLDEFTSERAWGEFGYLTDKGLIPLPADERERWRRAATELVPLVPPE